MQESEAGILAQIEVNNSSPQQSSDFEPLERNFHISNNRSNDSTNFLMSILKFRCLHASHFRDPFFGNHAAARQTKPKEHSSISCTPVPQTLQPQFDPIADDMGKGQPILPIMDLKDGKRMVQRLSPHM
ncbi:hypothetical protein PAAG_12129 [Paracoccidioides lutzii Pb01]|uniref:Uncharacterized protein n=1 Tax=Paracoccidioides lutzii (strain ATCC MYA-826 / Pb01) TaxID=502779 RepID=A0A0A2VJZ3_PARBA|nr:hypothetical protein PAAG_12129 [Paracoccidioides lutzii Pb01]KGQ01184.1 hypothetical protein PAAG_12129 [Paracoccidioides lutzii Pb01]